jgi:hypothetical protein
LKSGVIIFFEILKREGKEPKGMKKTGFVVLGLILLLAVNVPAENQNRKENHKLSRNLLKMNEAVKQGLFSRQVFEKQAAHAMRQGKLQCIIGVEKFSDEVIQACKDAGVEIISTHELAPDLKNMTVRISDPAQLFPVAQLPEVLMVATEGIFKTSAGVARSQGIDAMNVDAATSTYGVDGTGIRVGVLSDSFFDTRNGSVAGGFLTGCDDQNTGDLPASIRMIDRGPNDGSTIDEGNGMAQLIFDVAPGCDIAFASAFSGYNQFAANIAALRTDATAPSQVIVDDVIYFEEPMYQDGPIAIAARNAGLAGVPYFSSAGNSGDHAHEELYVDVNPGTDDTASPPTGVDLHDFGLAKGLVSDTHLQVTLADNDQIIANLHWDEPYGGVFGSGPGAEADLDIYIVDSADWPLSGNILGTEGDNFQGIPGAPSGNPVETASYVNTTGADQAVYVVVDHYDGRKTNLLLNVIISISSLSTVDEAQLVGDRTLFGHAAAENVHAVGAHRYDLTQAEPFTAKGGVLPYYFSDDGNTRYGTAQTRQKPEITAPDGTDTTFFGSADFDSTGFPNFFGTSAAAPHAAAVAALLLDASPGLDTTGVYTALEQTAVDIEAAGFDDITGYGIIDAFAAVGSLFSNVENWEQF